MAKLQQLIETCAETLGVERTSVNVLAMHLRKEGLIRSSGRGPNGAEMSATDASNLILAVLGGGYAKDAARTVGLIRAGWVEDYNCSRGNKYALPPLALYDQLNSAHTLGDALDGIINLFVAEGCIYKKRTGDPIYGTSFEIQPTLLGWESRLIFDDEKISWTARYRSYNKTMLELIKKKDPMQSLIENREILFTSNITRVTIEQINSRTFDVIAELLRR